MTLLSEYEYKLDTERELQHMFGITVTKFM
jgi:hypothetical protein